MSERPELSHTTCNTLGLAVIRWDVNVTTTQNGKTMVIIPIKFETGSSNYRKTVNGKLLLFGYAADEAVKLDFQKGQTIVFQADQMELQTFPKKDQNGNPTGEYMALVEYRCSSAPTNLGFIGSGSKQNGVQPTYSTNTDFNPDQYDQQSPTQVQPQPQPLMGQMSEFDPLGL